MSANMIAYDDIVNVDDIPNFSGDVETWVIVFVLTQSVSKRDQQAIEQSAPFLELVFVTLWSNDQSIVTGKIGTMDEALSQAVYDMIDARNKSGVNFEVKQVRMISHSDAIPKLISGELVYYYDVTETAKALGV